jgi:hypothetical protein
MADTSFGCEAAGDLPFSAPLLSIPKVRLTEMPYPSQSFPALKYQLFRTGRVT